MRFLSLIALLIVSAIAWTSCGRSDAPLVRVGDKKIILKELDRAWVELPSGYQNRGKRWLLETLINREILIQEAKARGLDHSEAVRGQMAKREEIEQAFEHFMVELRKKYENQIEWYRDNIEQYVRQSNQ